MESYGRATDQREHGRSCRLRRIIRVSRLAQHRSEYDTGANLLEFDRLQCRWYVHDVNGGPSEHAIHSVHSSGNSGDTAAPESVRLEWLLLVYGRKQQLQRTATGSLSAAQPRLAIPRELYLGQESGHQFRPHGRAGSEPGP